MVPSPVEYVIQLSDSDVVVSSSVTAISTNQYHVNIQQELNYRKQIDGCPSFLFLVYGWMRIQYVKDIHRLKYYTVTLKCRLRVTQGHWKRNHWIDHARLTISRVT